MNLNNRGMHTILGSAAGIVEELFPMHTFPVIFSYCLKISVMHVCMMPLWHNICDVYAAINCMAVYVVQPAVAGCGCAFLGHFVQVFSF